jgi:hypothetical protein
MPKTPCLFAPADDRNGPATPTAAVQFNRSRRDADALDQLAEASDCERCTPLGNESEGRFSTRSARNSRP